jgi:hypothetical protein
MRTGATYCRCYRCTRVAIFLALIAIHATVLLAKPDTCGEPTLASSSDAATDGATTHDAAQCGLNAGTTELHSENTCTDAYRKSDPQFESQLQGAAAELHDLLVNAKAAVAALGAAVARLEMRIGAVNVAPQSTTDDADIDQHVPLPSRASGTPQHLPGAVVAPVAQHSGGSFTTISEGDTKPRSVEGVQHVT